MNIHLNKGHDINISGKPEPIVSILSSPSKVKLIPDDFLGPDGPPGAPNGPLGAIFGGKNDFWIFINFKKSSFQKVF